MKRSLLVLKFVFAAMLAAEAGCEVPGQQKQVPAGNDPNLIAACTGYMASRVEVLPLTRFTQASSGGQGMRLEVYVGLFDAFNSQVKSPGVFRFELYERVSRSSQSKGKRLTIWPDIKLVNPADNNAYWLDYMRVYRFYLNFEPQKNQSCELQVTWFCPDQRRLMNDFELSYGE